MLSSSAPAPRESLLHAVVRLLPPYIQRFLALTALIHLPFVLVVHQLAAGTSAPWAIALGAGACGTLLFLLASRAWRGDRPLHPAARLLFDLPYWIHWSASLLTLVVAAVFTAALGAVSLARGEAPTIPVATYGVIYAGALAVAFYGTVIRRRRCVVREVPVRVTGLSAEFEGYRIAQLSDLHVGSMTPVRWAAEWVRATNGRAPDLTLVTGDLVQSGNVYDEAVSRALAALRATDGVYLSLGNHDYFGDAEALVARLRSDGHTVLRNEGRTLTRGAGTLHLAALDDTWTRRDDVGRALAARPEGAPVVLMAHDPESFWEAAAEGVQLTLSGHTHGGQIRVPGVPPMGQRLRLGRYLLGDSTLVVSPGLGTTGPPIRVGVPPTIIIFRLTAAEPVPAPRAIRVRARRPVATPVRPNSD